MSYRTLNLLALCAAQAVISSTTAAAAADLPQSWTLERAVAVAFARSPRLEIRRAEIEAAEAAGRSARTYPQDPQLLAGARRRSGEGTSSLDWDVALQQEVEVGGQRRRREAVATAELAATRQRLAHEERVLRARVESAWVEALRRRELVAIERANAELTRSLVEVARKRYEAGATAQMELNLAEAQAGSALWRLRLAEGEYEVAKALLAGVVGVTSGAAVPELEGALVPPQRELPALEELTRLARDRHAELAALRSEIEATTARIESERREAWPDLSFEVGYGEEEDTDRLFGGGISVRLPLFNRNQGGIAAASAERRRAQATLLEEEVLLRQELARAMVRYAASRDASAQLERQVLGTLEQNLALLERSFEAGKTSWTEVLVFRREFVEARRDWIDAAAEAWLASVEIDLAAGTL